MDDFAGVSTSDRFLYTGSEECLNTVISGLHVNTLGPSLVAMSATTDTKSKLVPLMGDTQTWLQPSCNPGWGLRVYLEAYNIDILVANSSQRLYTF